MSEQEVEMNDDDSLDADIRAAMQESQPDKIDPNLQFLKEEGSARDEKGRFAAKQEPEAVEKVEEKPITSQEPKPEADPAPQGWSGAVKDKWAALPPEVRQEIKKREDDFHRAMTSHDGDLRLGRDMKETLTPYMAVIQSHGMQPKEVVNNLLNTQYRLYSGTPEQKAAVVKEIINGYGVDINLLQGEEDYTDPTIAQLQQKIQQLEQTSNPQAIQKQLQEQQDNYRIQSEVQAFAADSKNVHYEKVKLAMATLLGNGLAANLQEAYDKACWADPTIRSTLIQGQQAEQEAKRKSEIEAKRNAGSSITGSPAAPIASNPSSPNDKDDIDADIRAAMRQHRSSI